MALTTDVLLSFTPAPDGSPWGTGTHMAARRQAGADPWDTGCTVTPLIGGYAAMTMMRETLETLIAAAPGSGQPPGLRGHVYIADWRLNAQRDLSDSNPWQTNPWSSSLVATQDQTVMGLLIRLIFAGVKVRVMIWLPAGFERTGVKSAHLHDHTWIAHSVEAANRAAMKQFAADGNAMTFGNLGVVLLDARTTPSTGSHHQKMMLVRGGAGVNDANGTPLAVAFVGGVDLAFTRRDAPGPRTPASPSAAFLDGDWQSSTTIPRLRDGWPHTANAADYKAVSSVTPHADRQQSDLYDDVYGDSAATDQTANFSDRRQLWHDQHLALHGPIVATIEGQFVDRWMDAGAFVVLSDDDSGDFGQARLSNGDELRDATTLAPLPDPDPVTPVTGGTATVQLWRTIPVRARSGSAYPDHHAIFTRGEFTVLAGYARAAAHAQHLLWICDQYFWSKPYGRLLHSLLIDPTKPDLNIIIILPPHADSSPGFPWISAATHRGRRETLNEVVGSTVRGHPRVSVWNLWDRRAWRTMPPHGPGLGIYAHAKAHTYDGSLIVCGSANINRRSLTGDSEIACAVLDPETVRGHQHRLWQLLFPDTPWPADEQSQDLDLDGSDTVSTPGQLFHDAFRKAAAAPTSFLTPDLWQTTTYNLPNGVERDGHMFDWDFSLVYNHLLEETSLPDSIEAPLQEPGSPARDATLADVAFRIAAGAFDVPTG